MPPILEDCACSVLVAGDGLGVGWQIWISRGCDGRCRSAVAAVAFSSAGAAHCLGGVLDSSRSQSELCRSTAGKLECRGGPRMGCARGGDELVGRGAHASCWARPAPPAFHQTLVPLLHIAASRPRLGAAATARRNSARKLSHRVPLRGAHQNSALQPRAPIPSGRAGPRPTCNPALAGGVERILQKKLRDERNRPSAWVLVHVHGEAAPPGAN